MSAAQRQCACGAPLPPDDGTGSVKCRACGRVISLTDGGAAAAPGPNESAAPPGAAPSAPSPPPAAAPPPIPLPQQDLPTMPPLEAKPDEPVLEPQADAAVESTPAPQPIAPQPGAPAPAPDPLASLPELEPDLEPAQQDESELHVAVPGEGERRFVPPAARVIGTQAGKSQQATRFSCGCGQVLHSRRLPGTQVMCPACGQILGVPGPDGQPADEQQRGPAYTPRMVIDFQCECGDTLRAEEGVGYSVMCLNCGREAIAPPEGKRIAQFQCECGAVLETEEAAGAMIACPACGKNVPVPQIEPS